MADLIERTGVNELIVGTSMFDQQARKDSYRRLMAVARRQK
jgi:hypothetical protein